MWWLILLLLLSRNKSSQPSQMASGLPAPTPKPLIRTVSYHTQPIAVPLNDDIQGAQKITQADSEIGFIARYNY